jgi:hypothetical protein
MLIDYVFDLEEIAHHHARGRPCLLTPEGYLGLLLFYLGSTMNYNTFALFLASPRLFAAVW